MADKGGPPHIDPLQAVQARVDATRDFDRAAKEVLEFLKRRIGFMHWLIVRFEDNKRVLLQASEDCLFVRPGEVLQLPAPLSEESHFGTVQCFIADTKHFIPDGNDKSSGSGPIRAFLELPIFFESGEQFGSLCAIDPMPQPEELKRELSLVHVFASIIGWLIESEQSTQEMAREAERAAVLAMTDDLTSLPNRRAWNHIILQETERSRRLGTRPQILLIDLDELKKANDQKGHAAGDDLLVRAASAILGACRRTDFVARIGGDEFGVFLPAGGSSGNMVRDRIRAALDSQGIPSSIGSASRKPPFDLEEAIREADAGLYEEKRLKKGTPNLAVVEIKATLSEELRG